MRLELCPVTRSEANEFIARHHRHHKPPQGFKFAIGVAAEGRIVGVVTVGRPVSRMVQTHEPFTAEATRCCTDGTRNAASMLYRAAWRAARAMGYRRLITYTLASERGTSLRAAGFRVVGEVKGRSWHRPGRPRLDGHPTEDKALWEVA